MQDNQVTDVDLPQPERLEILDDVKSNPTHSAIDSATLSVSLSASYSDHLIRTFLGIASLLG